MSHQRFGRTLSGVSESDRWRETEFSLCFEKEVPRLLRYAQRHVGAEFAEDVVAETFQIAWRKWDTLPEEKFPWLIGTARKVIANHVRSIVRRRRLADRLARLEHITADSSVDSSTRLDAARRLAELSVSDREALLLVAWDGLSSEAAATVLGIGPAAYDQLAERSTRITYDMTH